MWAIEEHENGKEKYSKKGEENDDSATVSHCNKWLNMSRRTTSFGYCHDI